MHFHLFNCHGEWTALAFLLAHAPLIGLWVRSLVTPRALAGGSDD